MFRYGGPIKEGVMHGMRNGGRTIAGGHQIGIPMGNRTGFQNPYSANYNLIDWKTGNRPPYRPINITGISDVGSGTSNATKLQRARNLLKSSKFSERGAYEALKKYIPKAWGGIKAGARWGVQKFPLVTLGAAGEIITRPRDVDKLVYEQEGYGPWEGRLRKTLDPTYNKKWMKAAEKYYKDKKLGKDKITTDKIIPSDKPEHLGLKPYTDPDKAKKLAKQKQNERLKSYLDMMGYDSAKKTALSDALIDASAIVQEGTEEAGSLKEADWSKMINKAIQTTSKRLDKPAQIREAVGLMATKAAIEKDMSAEEDALNKLYKQMQIKIGKKTLSGETLEESINAAYQKTGEFASGADLAGLARTKGIKVTKVISSTKIPEDMSAIDYLTKIVAKSHDAGKPFPPGNYVIKDRLVSIDVEGTITDLIGQ